MMNDDAPARAEPAPSRQAEPQKIQSLDAEFLSGQRFPYQEDISLVEGIDLEAATPGQDINWLEDIELLIEEGTPAVFDSYGIRLKEKHAKFLQPELGPWVEGSRTVGEDWQAPVLEGWEPPLH
jgi:hypothetical protein